MTVKHKNVPTTMFFPFSYQYVHVVELSWQWYLNFLTVEGNGAFIAFEICQNKKNCIKTFWDCSMDLSLLVRIVS